MLIDFEVKDQKTGKRVYQSSVAITEPRNLILWRHACHLVALALWESMVEVQAIREAISARAQMLETNPEIDTPEWRKETHELIKQGSLSL